MKKKFFMLLSLVCLLILAAVMLAACDDGTHTVTDALLNEKGELIFVYSDGSTQNLGSVNGAKGEQGLQGIAGVGIAGADINENGVLVLTYTDGRTQNLGVVTGTDGNDGADGVDGSQGVQGKPGVGIESVEYSADGTKLIIRYTDGSSQEIPLPQEEEFAYVTFDDGLYIAEYLGDGGTVTIPSEHNGEPIVGIGGYAFAMQSRLECVIIPDSIKTIGENAFLSCFNLTSVECGDGVENIGTSAFESCLNLTSVQFGKSVADIGDRAFYECKKLTAVDLPASVTRVGDSAFANCSSLASLTVSDAAAEIGSAAFADCAVLSTLDLGGSLVSIGAGAFSACVGLNSVTIPDSVTSVGESAFSGCAGLDMLAIGKGVQQIGHLAFSDCPNLQEVEYNAIAAEDIEEYSGLNRGVSPFCGSGTAAGGMSVTFGDNVEHIPAFLFINGSYPQLFEELKVKDVTIGRNVKSIGESAIYPGSYEFLDITDLAAWCAIEFEEYNPLYTAEKVYVQGVQVSSLVIPDGVESISDMAFAGCAAVTSIVLPDSVIEIGKYAFRDSEAKIVWGDAPAITEIGSMAFAGYLGKELTIPDSVTKVYSDSFGDAIDSPFMQVEGVIAYVDDWAVRFDSTLLMQEIEGASEAVIEIQLREGTVGIASVNMLDAMVLHSYVLMVSYPGRWTVPASVLHINERSYIIAREILFEGTTSEWVAISKETGWNNVKELLPFFVGNEEFDATELEAMWSGYVASEVQCTDGNVPIEWIFE